MYYKCIDPVTYATYVAFARRDSHTYTLPASHARYFDALTRQIIKVRKC